MAVHTKRLKDFPMNANPYHHDLYRMGTCIDSDWEVMYDKHEHNDFLIVIYKPTGERFMISSVMSSEIKTMTSL